MCLILASFVSLSLETQGSLGKHCRGGGVEVARNLGVWGYIYVIHSILKITTKKRHPHQYVPRFLTQKISYLFSKIEKPNRVKNQESAGEERVVNKQHGSSLPHLVK